MSGTARMSGIPYRPKDKVPADHGGTTPSDRYENQPEPVVYDKNGIVYPKAEKPQVTNAKEVSTKTAAEARAAAKARKVQEK